jgi:hypothetical protein
MRMVYRDIRQNILYEQEKVMFLATQELIGEIEIEKLQKQREGLDAKYEQIRKDRCVPLKEFRYSNQAMEVSKVLDHYFQLKANVKIVDEQLQDEREHITVQINNLQNKTSTTKRTYVLPCTSAECKAMLSNESKNKFGNYLCTICDGITCRECKMGISMDDHECDPDILKTVQFMESISKSCPSCGILIHKISGCSQMFCTSCHALFDWNTLRLNNGTVHNPYHAE